MPTTVQKSESKPVSGLPGQEFSCCSAGAASPTPAFSRIPAVRPSQPPTFLRPSSVSGVSAATITKNWSTSL